jgi:hypothetical protein
MFLICLSCLAPLGGAGPAAAAAEPATAGAHQGELLYNGIRLPAEWPPRRSLKTGTAPARVPYLEHPPQVIPIDVGRQLFVDDFLIEHTTLSRRFHQPEPFAGNPVLKPETPAELNGGKLPVAAMISDGVCYDPFARDFKLWYHAGWRDGTMLATSHDGLHWARPNLDVEAGTNRVLPSKKKLVRHGTGIAIDPYTTDPRQRFKMVIFEDDVKQTSAYRSADGVHWTFDAHLPECGDNTTIFYNPFRKKWVVSIRVYRFGRARDYFEADTFAQAIAWQQGQPVPWANTDALDTPDPGMLALLPERAEIEREAEAKHKSYEAMLKDVRQRYGDPTQLYNLDAVGYESVMLGVFGILRGPTNAATWDKLKTVKLIDLELAYSRDGFHWDRPNRRPFLASSRKPSDWDRGYLHAGVGLCTVMGDKLYFYYSGWSGESPKLGIATYAGGATGVAILRRDGFASMNAGDESGTLTTRPLTFRGRHLLVNAAVPRGELRVEALDDAGRVIAPFSADNCRPMTADSTRQPVTWRGADDLATLSGRRVKFRFLLRHGDLYAFWVSPDTSGASYGPVAAGGPEFNGPIDAGSKHE